METRDDRVFSKSLVDEIPKATGVYIFQGKPKDSGEPNVLYVGKAKNLASRVRQYFNDTDPRPFVEFIRKRAESIRTIVVATEQDALILENELIKKFRPPYNIHLRDDKRYLSLRLDLNHEWPKIDIVRKIRKDGAVYLGPFSSASRLRTTLDFLQKIFPLRTCSDHKLYNRSRPCIEYEIGRCVAPCVNYVSRETYKQLVERTVLFLKGKNEELTASLQEEMEEAAESDRFEEAARIRDQILAIEQTTKGQSVVGLKQFQQGVDQDAVGIFQDEGEIVICILFVRSGVILDQRIFEFNDPGLGLESFLAEFLERYYSSEVYLPHEILVPLRIDSEELIFRDRVFTPRSDEKKSFLSIAQENARIRLEAKRAKSLRLGKTLTQIQKLFHLERYPESIDCMDISHHQGMETVASVVRFRNGSPEKDFYRRIKLKLNQVNDFDSMKEVVERRYKSIEDLPSLLVIDGGPGQLNAAKEILDQRGWTDSVDLISLAKARDREGIDPLNPQNKERVFKPLQKNPILLKENSAEELLLRFIRDEAHRFAITYHRLRKNKVMSASALDEIKGMTARNKTKLLRRFGSVEGIREADDFELLKEIPEKLLLAMRLKFSELNAPSIEE